MTFGERVTSIRKQKGSSQGELGRALGKSGGDIIGKYERDEVTPSVKVAAKIAQQLDVQLDYLVGNNDSLLDPDIVKKIQEIQKLMPEDKSHVFAVIDAFLAHALIKTIRK